MGEVGLEPTVFTARVTDLQSADFAKLVVLTNLMTDTGVEPIFWGWKPHVLTDRQIRRNERLSDVRMNRFYTW